MVPTRTNRCGHLLIPRNSEIRFLNWLVRLWRLPPRFGVCSILLLQLKRETQLDSTSGLATIARKSPARWEAHAGRADLGICLMTVHSLGDHRLGWAVTRMASDTEAESAKVTAATAAAVWSLLPWERLAAWRGGLWEPGHGLERGPCLCIEPSLRSSCRVALQTLHMPFALFASWERGQDYYYYYYYYIFLLFLFYYYYFFFIFFIPQVV